MFSVETSTPTGIFRTVIFSVAPYGPPVYSYVSKGSYLNFGLPSSGAPAVRT